MRCTIYLMWTLHFTTILKDIIFKSSWLVVKLHAKIVTNFILHYGFDESSSNFHYLKELKHITSETFEILVKASTRFEIATR